MKKLNLKRLGQHLIVPILAMVLVMPVVMSFAVNTANAADLGSSIVGQMQTTGGEAGLSGTTGDSNLAATVGKLINQFLGLLGVVMVVLFIYAGVLWLTSQGNKDQITKAKGILINAVIGAVILFASYAIANFVVTAVITGTK